jgi:hypothetical protein
VAGVPALKDAHERIRAILELLDVLFHIGKGGTVSGLSDIAHAGEKILFHLRLVYLSGD